MAETEVAADTAPPAARLGLVQILLFVVLVGATLAIFGWAPRRSSITWLGVAISVVVGLLAETLKLPQFVRNLSPFEHVPALPAASFELLPLVLLVIVALTLTLVGLVGMARRDIG